MIRFLDRRYSLYVFSVSVLFSLCLSTAFAQCVIKDNDRGGIVECDVSFSLFLNSSRGSVASNAWNPDDAYKNDFNEQLNNFAKTWCEATAGYSRMGKISVFTDGRKADVSFYKDSSRGRGNTAVPGAFTYLKPSISLNNNYSGVIAHEFGHAMFKIYDEYRDRSRFLSAFCIFPLTVHNSRKTLMGSVVFNRFSYSADYPRRQNIRTAHYACYGKSAWEVITQPAYRDDPRSLGTSAEFPRQDYLFQLNASIPTAEQLNAASSIYSCDLPTINWHSGTSRMAVMMDHSASMADDRRLATAKRAVNDALDVLYAETPPVEIAIIGFDDTARTEVAPTRLDSMQNLRMIQSAVDSLIADGGTDFAEALSETQAVFENTHNDGQNLLIVVSDGEITQPNFSYFEDNGISVYTVELDTEGRTRLRDVITQARSRFNIEVDSTELTGFFPSVLRDASFIRNNQLTTSVSFESEHYDNKITTDTVISEHTDSASFILRWDDEVSFASFSLQNPNGTFIDQVYADKSSTDSVSYLEGEYQAIYHIASPIAGVWKVHIAGIGSFAYETAVSSGIAVGIHAGAEIILQETPSDVITYPEPIPILVHVGGISPIIRADVTAEITMPDESTMSVRLMDDGNVPDEKGGDGLYSGMLADYSQDGICEIKVTASNLKSNAMFDDTYLVIHHIGESEATYTPTVPEPAPLFRRVVYDQVDVVGTARKFIPPSLPAVATTITDIPYIVKRSIEQSGQVDWYQFNPQAEGKRYFIQTSNLMGYDNTEMVTELSLYEPDAATEVETSVRYRGSNVSSIEWTAPRAGDYFLSVAHAEQGRGYYEMTVSEENLLSEFEMERVENQSRRGGFVGYPLLLLLLFATIAFYRKSNFFKFFY